MPGAEAPPVTCRHFSVAVGNVCCIKEMRKMARETRQQLRQKSRQSQLRLRQEDKRMGQLERPQAIEKVGVRTARVSKALWPTAARRALALNRELLVHKRLAGLSRC